MRISTLYPYPKFELIGKTLTIRLNNEWFHATESSLRNFPNEGKKSVYNQKEIDQILVICNLFETSQCHSDVFAWFTQELTRQNPELSNTQIHFLVHNDVRFITGSRDSCADNVHFIDSFELTTKLIYDTSHFKHNRTKWNPCTKQVLFTPGKLRPARYQALKDLMHHFPDELVYTLSRYLICNIEPMSTEQKQLEWWLNDIQSMYKKHPSGIPAEEVVEFALEHETDTSDTDQLRMHDHTQMLSKHHLETTSLSVLVETVPWMSTEFYTEKTFACIAAGRPFLHYHDVSNYLAHRGYRLFCCNTDDKIQFIRNFLHQPDVASVEDTITHNLRTLNRNSNNTILQIAELFPEYTQLSKQQQIDTLITFNTIKNDVMPTPTPVK